MMTARFLEELRGKGISLSLEGDDLRYTAPAGGLVPDVRAQIVSRRTELIRFLKEAQSLSVSNAPPLRPRPRGTDRVPLSFAQNRLWFIDQLRPDSTAYNMPGVMRVSGRLEVEALERAINEIIRRHEILRTTFATDAAGKPWQEIHEPERRALPVADLAGLEESRRVVEAGRLLGAEGNRAFDLQRGPMVRTLVLRLEATEHMVLYTMHHIVSDGWSTGVLNREIGELYEAFSNGKPSPLAELAVQYADFALWQRQWLLGEPMAQQLRYWRKQLDGVSPLKLPADRSRPAVQSYEGEVHGIRFRPEMCAALKELNRREGVTWFMTLLAGLQVLLSRYGGQEDVAIGTPIANRNRKEIEGLIGFFVNTLVLRGDLSGDPTVEQLLQRVREATLGAYGHQDLPFEKLVEELQPERDMSRNPLFQVLLVMQNTPEPVVPMKGTTWRPAGGGAITTRFDLEAHVREQEDVMAAWMVYNTCLFERSTIERMMAHWERILAGMARNSRGRISELELMSAAERAQVLEAWNRTQADYARDKCLHQLFEEQAARTPEAVAVRFQGQQLTYRELNEGANQLAHYFRRQGIGPEMKVGLCVERSMEMVVALYGVLKAGAAYVPLDPAYPRDRVALMFEDAAVPVLLTQHRLLERLPPHRARVICLDSDWPAIAQCERSNGTCHAQPANLAYILYTSGSTGRPKGVALEHRGAVAFACWAQHVFARADLEGVLASTSLCFDLSIFEIFVPLSWGGTIVLVENILALENLAAATGVTLINTVPSAMRELLRGRAVPTSTRVVNLAGEPLPSSLVNRIYQQTPAQRVYDLYGPSETVTYSTFVLRMPDQPATIGKPLENEQVYLLDQRQEPVPIGIAGELHIGGVGVARGYYDRPEATAEKFLPNPFATSPGERFYRTGDLARYRPDGNLEFLGRMDHQVKIRGFRIELGDVESAIRGHPGVLEAIAAAAEDDLGERRLIGYAVAREGGAVSPGELKNFLKTKLPGYLVPVTVVILPALPRTPTGKLDRRALPAPVWAGAELAYVAPGTAAEEIMARTWRDVLKIERLGMNDSFFDLGGHSLMATQVISRVQQRFQIKIPLRRLFETPTPAGLIAALADQLGGRDALEEIARAILQVEQLSNEDAASQLRELRQEEHGSASPAQPPR